MSASDISTRCDKLSADHVLFTDARITTGEPLHPEAIGSRAAAAAESNLAPVDELKANVTGRARMGA